MIKTHTNRYHFHFTILITSKLNLAVVVVVDLWKQAGLIMTNDFA